MPERGDAPTRRRHRARNWILWLESGIALGLATFARRTVPFARLSRFLGRVVTEPGCPDLAASDLADMVWALSVWRRRWPWPAACLTEVLALRILFDRRGWSGATHIAVRAGGANGLDAHAWMRCGSQVLPREQDLSGYRVLSIFQR